MKKMKNKRETQSVQDASEGATENTTYQEIIRMFSAACETVREKKERAYAAYEKAHDAFFSEDTNRIKLPVSNPLDLSKAEEAILTTGDPAEAKRYIAYARSIAAPITLDEDFSSAIIRAVTAIGPYAIPEDDRLSAELAAAEQEMKETVKKMEEKVRDARERLYSYRMMIADDIVKPVMELDCLYHTEMPSFLVGPVGEKMRCLVYGTNVHVKDQLQSLLNQVRRDRSRNCT